MPGIFQGTGVYYTADKTLESGENSLEGRIISFNKPIVGGTLWITIGGSGTFSIQVKFGDGGSRYGPYKTLKDETQEAAYSPASLQFNLA